MRAKTTRGAASQSTVRSVACRATFFGINSPKVTCRKVISRKATATAAVCVAASLQRPGSEVKSGSSRSARAGSATQPRPMLARVIPSWVAAIERSSRLMAASTVRAPFWPR